MRDDTGVGDEEDGERGDIRGGGSKQKMTYDIPGYVSSRSTSFSRSHMTRVGWSRRPLCGGYAHGIDTTAGGLYDLGVRTWQI